MKKEERIVPVVYPILLILYFTLSGLFYFGDWEFGLMSSLSQSWIQRGGVTDLAPFAVIVIMVHWIVTGALLAPLVDTEDETDVIILLMCWPAPFVVMFITNVCGPIFIRIVEEGKILRRGYEDDE